MSFHLFLIRHGQSANNALPEAERVEDPGLTQLGGRQADLLAAHMQGIHETLNTPPITQILTSGFARALDTTRPMAATLQLAPGIWTEIHEVGGCYRGYRFDELEGRPGLNRAEIAARYPEFQLPDNLGEEGWWRSQPFEQHDQARLRARQQTARLRTTFHGTDLSVACVIHADFKALLLEEMTGSQKYVPADLQNTGVTVLRFHTPDAPAEVVLFNDVAHLTDGLTSS